MASLEHFDLCVGEALEVLENAAKELKNYDKTDFESKDALAHVGKAVYEIWEARELLYAKKPELKRDFKQEFEANTKRYEELSQISQQAQQLEQDGKLSEAIKIYKELLKTSKFGFFELVAQVGLYRCKNS